MKQKKPKNLKEKILIFNLKNLLNKDLNPLKKNNLSHNK